MSNLLGRNWLAPPNVGSNLLGWAANGKSMKNYTATELRTLIDAGVFVNVKDYGAVADGVTDDGAAISAAFAVVRAQTGFKTPILIPPGDYYIGTGINATDIRPDAEAGGVRIIANGARFLGNCTGKPVIDCTRSLQFLFEGLTVIGDDTNVPLCAFQFARGNNSESADAHTLSFVTTKGNYSRCAVYNFASERFGANNCIIRNYASGADKYALIIDGQNYYGATSDYYTITNTQYTSQSCLNFSFISTTFGSGTAGSTGSAIRLIGASRVSTIGCYIIARGDRPGVEICNYSGGSNAENFYFDVHMETEGDISHGFYFKDLSGGSDTSISIDNFYWKENSSHIGVDSPQAGALFGSDLVGNVIIRKLEVVICTLQPTATTKVFENARFSVSGDIAYLVQSSRPPTGLDINFFNGDIHCTDFSGVTLPLAGTYRLIDYAGSTHSVTQYGNYEIAEGLLSDSALIGYKTGAGGTVTQLTDKTTAVELNKACGSIETHDANLVAGTIARFTLTNSYITTTSAVVVHRRAGGADSSYNVWVDSVAAGSAEICIQNVTGGDLAQAITIRFMVFSGVVA